jgi:hypothetical protein
MGALLLLLLSQSRCLRPCVRLAQSVAGAPLLCLLLPCSTTAVTTQSPRECSPPQAPSLVIC